MPNTAGHQLGAWLPHQAGWLLIAALVLAGALGVFGGGPLSRAALKTRDARLELEYQRFWRMNAPTSLRLRIAAGAPGETRIWLSRDYLESVTVSALLPLPTRTTVGDDRYVFAFDTSGAHASIIILTLEPGVAGRLRGEVGLENGPSLRFSQFIYP